VGEVAYYGDRYIQVAANTGGTAISIRGNFANALQSLGFAVSGLRNDFRLSRGPFTDSLEAYLTQVNAKKCTLDNECPSPQKCRSGACATQITVGARNFGACVPSVPPPWDGGTAPPLVDYCKCDSGAFRNIMRFPDAPPAQSSIEICYDVNSNFNQACQ
jgi:hypothetical protein